MKVLWTYLVFAICCGMSRALPKQLKKVPSLERYNFFDSELLKEIGEGTTRNLVISPVGVKIILGILLEGAQGQTAEELRNILRLPQDAAQVRREFEAWLNLIQSMNAQSFLKISNMVLVAKKFSIRRGFRKVLWKHYATDVKSSQFHNQKETSKMINDWVSEKTNHLITKLTEPHQISSDAQMMLLNTLYFKGQWLNPFEREKSSTKCFHTLDSGCVKTCMLGTTGLYKHGYVDRLDAHAIQIPYAGNKYFMLILLPTTKGNIFGMTRDLLHVSLKSILGELREEEVYVQIPRFEISYSEDLSDYLMQLELTSAFRQGANFSKMFQLDSDMVPLGHIFHSAKIIVNEGGTQAAAVTGAFFMPLMANNDVWTSFNAQHPFLFFIMDSVKHSVIFAGRFMKPEVSDDITCSTKGKKASSQKAKPKVDEKISGSIESTIKNFSINSERLPQSLKHSAVIFLGNESSDKPQQPSSASQVPVSLSTSSASEKSSHVNGTTEVLSTTPAAISTGLATGNKIPSSNSTKLRAAMTAVTNTSATSSTVINTSTTPSTITIANTRKGTSSPFSTTFTSTTQRIMGTPLRAKKIPQKPMKSSFIIFPTDEPEAVKIPVFPRIPTSQSTKTTEENVKPILIHGEVPYMYYPFSEKLKEVWAGPVEAAPSTTKSTVNPNDIPITHSAAYRGDRSKDRWNHFQGQYSDPNTWLHRILFFH